MSIGWFSLGFCMGILFVRFYQLYIQKSEEEKLLNKISKKPANSDGILDWNYKKVVRK